MDLKRLVIRALGWVAASLLMLIRWSCRIRILDDPRPGLLAEGKAYMYALFHAHQVAGILSENILPLGTMASRSRDGDAIVPILKVRGLIPVRGSTRKRGQDKGGGAALHQMHALLARNIPVCLTIDGPRGPRGQVHPGIIKLAQRSGAPILPILMTPSRRWISERTWDRFQVPKPFATITVRFGEPIYASAEDEAAPLQERVAAELMRLEETFDPEEAARAAKAAARWAVKRAR